MLEVPIRQDEMLETATAEPWRSTRATSRSVPTREIPTGENAVALSISRERRLPANQREDAKLGEGRGAGAGDPGVLRSGQTVPARF
jgi:hypothetical protein